MRPQTLHPRELEYLRKRSIQKFGENLTIFGVIGAMGMGVTVLLLIYHPSFFSGIVLDTSIILGLATCFFFALVHLTCRRLTPDQFKSFAFYLRPFDEDRATFAADEQGCVNYLDEDSSGKSVNFESFAGSALQGTGYHVVCIGAPNKLLPRYTAVTLFPSDFCWKFFVRRLVDSASFVLIRCQDTPGFRWELSHLVARLDSIKVLLCIGHQASEEASWPATQRILAAVGYDVPKAFPGHGCIIHFPPGAPAERLSSHLISPSDFSEALRQAVVALDARKKQEIAPASGAVVVQPQSVLPASASVPAAIPAIVPAEWKRDDFIPATSGKIEVFLVQRWRTRFLSNPFSLGPSGIGMLFIWLVEFAGSIWLCIHLVANNDLNGRVAVPWLAATFTLIFATLRGLAPRCAKATQRWAAHRRKTLEEILGEASSSKKTTGT